MEGTSWHGNEPFEFTKGGEFIDHFIKYNITENVSIPWSSVKMRIWHRTGPTYYV